MANKTIFLDDKLHQYWLSISLKDHPVLQALRTETLALGNAANMQIAPEQRQFMGFLLKLIGAKRVLELGTFTGYSSLCMALALPEDGIVVTCDRDSNTTAIAQNYWQKANMQHKIQSHLGDAKQYLQECIETSQQFDFIFIDADKRNYINYYQLSLPLLSPRGVIAIDNVFMRGNAAVFPQSDPRVRVVQELNALISQDPTVESTTIPIGDGLTLVRKIS